MREKSREAAPAAAREVAARFDAEVQRFLGGSGEEADKFVPQIDQIVPTHLNLENLYLPGASNRHELRVVHFANTAWSTREAPVAKRN